MVTAHSVRTGRATPVRSAPAARPAAPLTPRAAVAAVAAWGSGLVCAALGAAGLTGAAVASHVVGGILLALAALALGWGATSLARGRVTVPRTATAVALAAPVLLGIAVAADPARSSILGATVGIVLAVVVGVLVASTLRRDDATRPVRTASRAGMAALLVAAAVTTAVVVPALSAVQDAQLKPGQLSPMQMDMDMGGHGH
ncbi:hypothetical protein [Microbacterium sp.]|uniref:hypothetical protein n=1 Tax=Microbacterium sp. TaxID=51671 RepID=UPI000926C9A8|nr:hypothetical protein [Microbacterium sp.]MBN9185600.1 hypothetical protein [Microbacterium sp.]MBN9194355.1 hypothetical protein [Microbacterium sp.]OJU70501.1 MAG: hypothetical protein BGO04_03995 [Microbacterium sp. 70-38]